METGDPGRKTPGRILFFLCFLLLATGTPVHPSFRYSLHHYFSRQPGFPSEKLVCNRFKIALSGAMLSKKVLDT
jgi:hypothetical protein